MNQHTQRQLVDRLLALGYAIRDKVCHVARTDSHAMSDAVAHEGGDTIFAIDRHVETIIESHLAAWPADLLPLTLVAEGMGDDGILRIGPAPDAGTPKLRILIDPIDGTRNIMYDKRSAWFIAAAAPDTGDSTCLSHAAVSVAVELPTSKHGYADAFATSDATGTLATRRDLRTGHDTPLHPQPSSATTLRHGFAQVSNFFPGVKVLAASLMEAICLGTLGRVEAGQADVFDDQYMTTAGQMLELALGRDRFCCDLRPLFYRILEQRENRTIRGLECHPYDCAAARIATDLGVILTDGFGQPLDAPMNVHHPTHWCGYANKSLQTQIQPIIQTWLTKQGIPNP